MTTRTRSFLARSAVIGLLMLSGGVSRLNSAVPPGIVSGGTDPADRSASFVARKSFPSRISSDECSALALKATIAKARAEMRSLVPGMPGGLSGISASMTSDRRLSERIKQTFGNSDLIKSEYSRKGGCVVTLKLSLDRLQLLARDL